jgi:hypothetical protein
MVRGRIGIPADVLSILEMLVAKELRFLLMTGTKFATAAPVCTSAAFR